jgi:hypothetical protein
VPLYWFRIDVPTQPQILDERLRSVVRDEAGLDENWRQAWTSRGSSGQPFLGHMQDDGFALRLDTHYRNSFHPVIRGRIIPTQIGAQVNVFMFLHPFTTLFMMFWLGVVGYAALRGISASSWVSWMPCAMFAFGVALTTGPFFREALEAKRLLIAAALGTSEDSAKQIEQP